jgi:membrane-anchored protein YejM (alkaline phosphatase superfamily)
VVTQAIHIVAYEVSDTRFTSITPQLPFYFPMRSHRNAVKYGRQLALVRESETNASPTGVESLHYPLHDAGCAVRADRNRTNVVVLLVESWRADAMDSVTTPRLFDFARDASTFLDHFSSGNSTPSGVFSLFYGIHSTY